MQAERERGFRPRSAPSGGCDGGRGGFTLVELLVVIGVIAILASLVLPAISNSIKAARSANCWSNLHQISAGLVLYIAHHTGLMPPSGSPSAKSPNTFPYWYKNLEPFTPDPELFRCPAKNLCKYGYGLNHMWCGPDQIYGAGTAMNDHTKLFDRVTNPAGTLVICDTGVVTNKDDPPERWMESDAANVNGCVRFPYDNRPGEPGAFTYWHSDPRRPVPRHLMKKTNCLFFDTHADGIPTADIVDDLWDEAGCVYDNDGEPMRK
ncbi:MAG TPA: prepilin-type N-terminal cleavage/methylation domain-containing protein [Planctomycetota bacterium]|nr:prepilin-type N-terminal cleavage/methylation domain-containing protein [Planctomycetota bacterium]